MVSTQVLRRFDYYAGVPLCFLLTGVRKLQEFFGAGKALPYPPKKVLLIELTEMGTTILATPAIAYLKERYPGVQVYFWTFEENTAPLKLLQTVLPQNILTSPSDRVFPLVLSLLQILWKIRRLKIDTVIDLDLFTRYSAALSFLSGARRRIGFHRFFNEGLYRGDLHTHRVSYNYYQHVSETFLAMAKAIEVPSNQIPLLKTPQNPEAQTIPFVVCSEDEKRVFLSRFLELKDQAFRFVLLNPGLNDRLKIRNWSLPNYVEMAARLNRLPKTKVVLVGKGGEERLDPEQFKGCVDLIGRLSIPDLIPLFYLSSVLLSHDCGLLHLASLSPIHVVGLFGPETPRLYQPLTRNQKVFYRELQCSPCLSAFNHRQTPCSDNQCLKQISVDQVFEHVAKVLSCRVAASFSPEGEASSKAVRLSEF